MVPLTDRLRSVRRLVGGTPLLAIECRRDGGAPFVIHAKAEHLNLTGSIKDRAAVEAVRRGLEDGALDAATRLVAAAEGHTGVSVSAVGSAIGRRVQLVMPDDARPEHTLLARAYGAELHLAPRALLPTLADELARATPGAYRLDRLSPDEQAEAHRQTTARELWLQLLGQHAVPDAFVTGVGTGGTLRGVGQALRREIPSVRVHHAHAADGGEIPGWRPRADGPLPGSDGPVAIAAGDAILMAQKLARELGLGVGISSGANVVAALRLHETLGAGAVVTTVLCDSNRTYLDGPLLRETPVRDGYLTPRATFVGFRAINRSCLTCVDPQDTASFPTGIFEMAKGLERRMGR
ncbi:MAG: pyridoxal-phosphate dependent enzyme [Gemmatimonadota bacterium]|jgi:cysteine synthase A|nr:pyridoxal-phosphate dependent enzyme [Gemmatimonadota bacterium]MDQ8147172.1 pyridoxal-phosphate dependent enzyme [Gemmatimonadota bacterium]MDQ8156330.1 pyridoxal-phosphate dependent enzyme [Gemmatimonadota bacterium]MDQ8177642.1 pyridoxal-phosphate dependent enzyme [Gemmatimonadota bacterium]